MQSANSKFDAGIKINVIFLVFGTSLCMSTFVSDNFVRNRLSEVKNEPDCLITSPELAYLAKVWTRTDARV